MWKVNKGFKVKDEDNYAKHANEALELNKNLIDCSLGINPFGTSEKVAKSLLDVALEDITHYPKSNDSLKKLVAGYWSDQVDLSMDQIQFTHGSMGACEMLNRILLNEKSQVLGVCPQFAEYILDVEKSSANFTYISLKQEDNYKFNLETVLAGLTDAYDLLYIDNPNNPTGQIIPLEDIEVVVRRAANLGVAVIVDEAYGDFMPKENSAISLINTYDNLLLVRSFSKGFGLAGLRIGYAVVPASFAQYLEKVVIAFPINSMGQKAITHVFEDPDFLTNSLAGIARNKETLIGQAKKLGVLHTDMTVPIMTLVHPDKNVDLQQIFMERGMLTNSCKSYHNLSQNSVRLRVPVEVEPVVDIIRDVEEQM